MKSSVLIIVLSLVLAVSTEESRAQWIQTSGPPGQVSSFAISGSNIFAGTNSGIFLSTDNGASWTSASSGEGYGVHSLTVSGSDIYAATYFGGVFLSTNNGMNWTGISAGRLPDSNVTTVAVNGSYIFAGTDTDGVFLSTNNGTTWTAVDSGLTNKGIQSLVVSGTNIFAGTSGGVFLTSDSGETWTAINSGLGNTLISTLTVNGTDIFAGTDGSGVYLSSNGGKNWSAANSGMTSGIVSSIVFSGSNVFAGTPGGVYLSTNNGTSWTAARSGLADTGINALAVSGSTLLAGTYGDGVFASTDNGTSWTTSSSGLINGTVNKLAAIGNTIFAGNQSAGVFRSSDNGVNWTRVVSGMTSTVIQALAVDGTNILAGTNSGGVFLSTNSGTNWAAANTGLSNKYITALGSNASDIFVSSGDSVFLSTNHGASWSPANAGLPASYITSFAFNGDTIFAGTFAGVYVSTNNGTSWTNASSGLTNTFIENLAVSGNTVFAGTFGGGVFRSTNNGASWTAVNSGLPFLYIYALAASGNSIFAGIYGFGVFLSTDNGTSWTSANTGLTGNATQLWSLAVSDTALVLGSVFNGVLIRPLAQMIPPPVPVLASPTNNATNLLANDVLVCNKATGATGYDWQVATDIGFTSLTVNTSTTDTSLAVHSLFAGTKYYWRVRSVDQYLLSAFSPPDSFTVMPVPAVPVLATPANNTTNERVDTVIFRWHPVLLDSGYVCQVSSSPSFSSLVASQDTTKDTSFTVTSLAHLTTYYWRVLAYNAVGSGSFSSSDSFTTVIATPAVPVAVSPAANATNQATSLALKVNPVANAAGYRWQVSTSSAFSPLVVDDSTSGTSDTAHPVSSLHNLTKYYWRALSYNAAGASSFSLPDSFTTIIALPSTPVASYPASNATNQPISVTLKVGPAANAAGYRWQVSASSTFSPLVVDDSTSGAGDTANSVSSLQNSTKYYWRVLGYNAAGAGSFSLPDSFTTIVGVAPTPIAAFPSANALNVPTTLILKVGPVANAAGYRWQVSTNFSFSPLVVDDSTSGSGDTANTVSSLQNLTKYYWRALAYNAAGSSSFSSPDSFTTIIAVPSVPIQRSPLAGAANVLPHLTLTIDAVANAAGYHWQVSSNSGFTSPVIDDSTTGANDTLNAVTLTAGTKYFWHVQSFDLAGASAFSSPDSFYVMAVPAVPLLASPANNASFVRADTLAFQWHSVSGDTGYVCQISTGASFSSLVSSQDTTRDTSFTVTSLQNLTKYYWRVLAYNGAGSSSFSLPDSFTTIVAKPSTPTIASSFPVTGAPRLPTFAWNPSARATKYRLQLGSDSTFSTVVVDTTSPDTSVRISDTLRVNTTYFWHVSAIDTAGASPFTTFIRFTTGTATGVVQLDGVPAEYALRQNFPNPFNPTTTIRFDLKQTSNVTLKIYNIIGQEVLVKDYGMMNAGRFNEIFNMGREASGIYIYRIVAKGIDGENFVAVKKMLLVK